MDSYRGSASDPLSLNLYTYCTNNPIFYADPTGHWPQWLDDVGDWASGTVDDIKQWWDESNASAYVYTTVEVVGGTATTVVSGIAIVATGGTGGGFAWVSLAHGVNSLSNGIRDTGNIIDGDFEAVGSENYLRDNVYKPTGELLGNMTGSAVDFVYVIQGDNSTNFAESFSDIGENVGNFTYYGVDILGGAQGVKSSVQTIASTSKLKNLHTVYYIGNSIDGFQKMNNLQLYIVAPSAAAKTSAGISMYLDGANIYYDGKDVISPLFEDDDE